MNSEALPWAFRNALDRDNGAGIACELPPMTKEGKRWVYIARIPPDAESTLVRWRVDTKQEIRSSNYSGYLLRVLEVEANALESFLRGERDEVGKPIEDRVTIHRSLDELATELMQCCGSEMPRFRPPLSVDYYFQTALPLLKLLHLRLYRPEELDPVLRA